MRSTEFVRVCHQPRRPWRALFHLGGEPQAEGGCRTIIGPLRASVLQEAPFSDCRAIRKAGRPGRVCHTLPGLGHRSQPWSNNRWPKALLAAHSTAPGVADATRGASPGRRGVLAGAAGLLAGAAALAAPGRAGAAVAAPAALGRDAEPPRLWRHVHAKPSCVDGAASAILRRCRARTGGGACGAGPVGRPRVCLRRANRRARGDHRGRRAGKAAVVASYVAERADGDPDADDPFERLAGRSRGIWRERCDVAAGRSARRPPGFAGSGRPAARPRDDGGAHRAGRTTPRRIRTPSCWASVPTCSTGTRRLRPSGASGGQWWPSAAAPSTGRRGRLSPGCAELTNANRTPMTRIGKLPAITAAGVHAKALVLRRSKGNAPKLAASLAGDVLALRGLRTGDLL